MKNDTNKLTGPVIENEGTVIFCRKCGNMLVLGMNTCEKLSAVC